MGDFFYRRLVLLPVLALFLDRYLKFHVQRLEEADPITLIPNVLTFEYFANPGIAFSIPFSGPLLWIISLIILVVFTKFAIKGYKNDSRIIIASYLFFIFGALSNLFDRINYGITVDYFLFFGRSAVNIADAMIIFGAVALIFSDSKLKKISK